MTAHRLTTGQKIGFTLGDFASNLYWQSVSIFLLFFYTDAVGLTAATAGLIYMIASIVDALADPVMGSIADRTRTKRGRYRPYILFGCVPLGLSFVLLYWRPPVEGVWLAVWMMATHIVFRFAYTLVTIPYTSLNARLTSDSDERSTLAGYRMVFAVCAALLVSYFTYPLVGWLGRGNAAAGYAYAAAVFAVIATAIYPLVYAVTREPDESGAAEPVLTLGGYWRGLAGNRAFWVLTAATVVASVCTFALGKSILYYFKYYIHDEAAARFAFTAMSGAGLVIIPAWVWVTRYVGKQGAWMLAVGWGLVMLAVFALTDFRMLPDTVEYGEWNTGARTESFIFGLFQFFLKAALGIGAGLFGWLLSGVGYVANQDQSAATLAGIKHIMIVLPGIGLIAAGLIMLFYPLRRGTHAAILADLQQRVMVEPEAV